MTHRIRARGEDIRRYILETVGQHPRAISKMAAEKFGITRQAVNKHLQRLTAEGALTEAGNTRGRAYALRPQEEWARTYAIGPGLAEDVIWTNDIRTTLGTLADSVMNIWHYGFTEMFNNAIDHSDGTQIVVQIRKNANEAEMIISDNGVGIFKKIQNAMNLFDERHAILELSKGKLTTDPTAHSGQGIFFTSRAFDSFDILSGGVYFGHEFGRPEDWVVERGGQAQGTTVFMRLNNHTARTLKAVFDEYSTDGDFGFTKTVVPVKLAQYGSDQLISRSQAKRVLARVELFKTVMFDFDQVKEIGQAFADEIFRVFRLAHPEMSLVAIRTSPEVRQMIERAYADLAANPNQGQLPLSSSANGQKPPS